MIAYSNVSSYDRWVLTKLSNDELLLYHLNFFVESLKIDEIKFVNVLKEDPDWSKSCSIEILHEISHADFRVALKLFEWNGA